MYTLRNSVVRFPGRQGALIIGIRGQWQSFGGSFNERKKRYSDSRAHTCHLLGSSQVFLCIPEPIVVGAVGDADAGWISTLEPELAWTVKSALLARA